MNINYIRHKDVLIISLLMFIAALTGFLYHADGWAVFWDPFRVHIDTHLYYYPLKFWGSSMPEAMDLPVRYALFQMPKGYLFFNFWLHKAVPLVVQVKLFPILFSLVAVYFFYRLMRLCTDEVASFVSTLVFIFHAWTFHTYQALCPRAFFYPLLLAFLFCFQSRHYGWSAVVYILQCLFYPQAAVISLVTVLLTRLSELFLSKKIIAYLRWALGFGLAGVIIAAGLYWLQFNPVDEREFGPLVSLAQMKSMPEFYQGGKEMFFFPIRSWMDWLMSKRAGIALNIPLVVLFCSSILLWVRLRRTPALHPFPDVFKGMAVGSLILFLLAYALLFMLYFPARYAMFTIPVVVAVWFGCGVSGAVKLCAPAFKKILLGGIVLVVAAGYGWYLKDSRVDASRGGLVCYDHVKKLVVWLRNIEGSGIVAAHPHISDTIPLYAGKRVLFSNRLLIPFQMGYYSRMERRVADFFEAYYATSIDVVRDFCRKYGVDYLVVNRADFFNSRSDVLLPHKRLSLRYVPLRREYDSCAVLNVGASARVYDDGSFFVIDVRKL